MPGQPVQQQINTQQLVLRNPFITNPTYTDSGSGSTIAIGTVMGRVFASGLVIPLQSNATDGSQIPVGIAADTYVVTASASVAIDMLIRGELNGNMVVLVKTGDTLNTTVGIEGAGGTIGDLITAQTELIIVPSLELSRYDNPIS